MARNTKHNIFTVRKVMILHVSVILFTGAGGLARRHPTLGRQPPSPWQADTPTPAARQPSWQANTLPDGHCSGRYASYWNAFLLPPTNIVCEGYVFTGVCLSTGGGVCIPACLAGHMTSQGGSRPRPGGGV